MTSSDITSTSSASSITLSYTTPDDTDLSSILVLRSTSAITDTPVEGTTYATSSSVGSATVVCSHAVIASTTYSCVSSSLTNGTPYYYKIFALDSSGNYSTGADPVVNPFAPGSNITTLGSGIDPVGGSISPSASATTSNTFTFQTSSSTDIISSVTLTLATSTATSTALIEITNDAGSTVYGSISNPSSDTPTITLSTNTLTASTTSTQYSISLFNRIF